ASRSQLHSVAARSMTCDELTSSAMASRRRLVASASAPPAARLVVSAFQRFVVEYGLLQLRAFQHDARKLSREQLLHRTLRRLHALGCGHGLRCALAEDALLRHAFRTHRLKTVHPRLCGRARNVVPESWPADVLPHSRAGGRFFQTMHIE